MRFMLTSRRDSASGAFGFGTIATAASSHFPARRAKHPGHESGQENQGLAMSSDDGFAFPFGNRS
jgi:hypothetical protein